MALFQATDIRSLDNSQVIFTDAAVFSDGLERELDAPSEGHCLGVQSHGQARLLGLRLHYGGNLRLIQQTHMPPPACQSPEIGQEFFRLLEGCLYRVGKVQAQALAE